MNVFVYINIAFFYALYSLIKNSRIDATSAAATVEPLNSVIK